MLWRNNSIQCNCPKFYELDFVKAGIKNLSQIYKEIYKNRLILYIA